jgi:hypothetical protein
MELRKIYGKWDTGIGKYWHRIETTGGKSLKRPQRAVEPLKKKKNVALCGEAYSVYVAICGCEIIIHLHERLALHIDRFLNLLVVLM